MEHSVLVYSVLINSVQWNMNVIYDTTSEPYSCPYHLLHLDMYSKSHMFLVKLRIILTVYRFSNTHYSYSSYGTGVTEVFTVSS